MQDLSLHILDIAENSVRAGATLIEIRVVEDTATDVLRVEIIDNGRGMDAETCRKAMSPYGTTRTERKVGLGLPMLAQSAAEAEGECAVDSVPGKGTRVTATFKHSHIDRRPLGDLGRTFRTLTTGNPDIDFVFDLWTDGQRRRIDTRALRACQQNPPRSCQEPPQGAPDATANETPPNKGALRCP